ncbi:MAG: N-acetyltransferase [Chloroflexi bacterium]|nr:MAG: N-acetyltransferase [Chloroflexota bacterium]
MYYYGEKIRLRPPERADLPLFVQWLSNPEMRKYVTIRYISQALEERWFENLLPNLSGAAPARLHFVIETLGETQPIGVIGLENINWRDRETEMGIIVGEPDFWGRGYGSDALHTVLEVGFRWYNLHRIFLRVVADNTRAILSYEKCGFVHEGRQREAAFIDGCYKDLLLMSVLENEFNSKV